MKPRTHSEPLPKGVDRVVSLFKRVMQLSHLVKVEVTPEEFVVTRMMDSDEDPVLPKAESQAEVDIEYMISNIDLKELEFEPNSHPYMSLARATEKITAGRLKVVGIMAPSGDMFSDFFGLAEHSMPETFLGIRVVYHDNARYPDKLVIVGSPTVYFNDATHGVIVDMGV